MKLAQITNSLTGINKDYVSSLKNIASDGLLGGNTDGANSQSSFSDILKKSITELNETQVEAYEAMSDIATGKVDNLQDAVKKIEEAEMSLKLSLEVKNKALGAYKQIMSMQI